MMMIRSMARLLPRFSLQLFFALVIIGDASHEREDYLLNCSRDRSLIEEVWSREALGISSVAWSKATRAKVRSALKTPLRLDLPRIYIQPIPDTFFRDDFKDKAAPLFWAMTKKLHGKRALNDANGTKLNQSQIETFYYEYMRPDEVYLSFILHDFRAFSVESSRLRRTSLNMTHYTPSLAAIKALHEQHILGFVFHRALATKYAHIVKNAQNADLIFVPFYAFEGFSANECSLIRKPWLDALRISARQWPTKQYFFTAMHKMTFSRSSLMQCDLGRNNFFETEPHNNISTARNTRQPILALDVPLELRATAMAFPVPYYTNFSEFPGPAFSQRPFRLMFLGKINDKKTGLRAQLIQDCSNTKSCFFSDPAGHSFPSIYHDTVFALQPPGISAARKGIIDAIAAGSIPIVFEDYLLLTTKYQDQSDLWPWNWFFERASALVINATEYTSNSLGTMQDIINQIDDDQLALMREIILRLAPALNWALPPDPDSSFIQAEAHLVQEANQQYPHYDAVALAMHHLWYIIKHHPECPVSAKFLKHMNNRKAR